MEIINKMIKNKKLLFLWCGLFLIFFGLINLTAWVDCVQCWSYDSINNEVNINYTSRFLKCNSSEIENEKSLNLFFLDEYKKNMGLFNFTSGVLK